MKFKKYFVRYIETDVTEVVTPSELLEIVSMGSAVTVRVTPLDSNGELLHEYSFLVGSDYSLSFLFNYNTV